MGFLWNTGKLAISLPFLPLFIFMRITGCFSSDSKKRTDSTEEEGMESKGRVQEVDVSVYVLMKEVD